MNKLSPFRFKPSKKYIFNSKPKNNFVTLQHYKIHSLAKHQKSFNTISPVKPFTRFIKPKIYGTGSDPSTAFVHFMNAASKGHNEAERALGIYYYQGFGCAKDEEKGKYWVEKAIEDGNVRAYCTLAHVYMNGLGVEVDLLRGFKLYRCAAELGDEHAMEHLEECYRKGIGVEVDIVKADEIKARLAK